MSVSRPLLIKRSLIGWILSSLAGKLSLCLLLDALLLLKRCWQKSRLTQCKLRCSQQPRVRLLIEKFAISFGAPLTKLAKSTWLLGRICAPKQNGGLGLKSARELNRAYMTKLAFTFFQEPERLWVKILQSKYFKETDEGIVLRSLRSKSGLWKGISKEWQTMVRGAKSAIRDGRDTPFLDSCWVDTDVKLIDLVEDGTSSPDLEAVVADFVEPSGQWDVEKLQLVLPNEAVNLVVGLTPPRADRGEDIWVWGEEENGRFSIKLAYNMIWRTDAEIPVIPWTSVWQWRGPNRIRFLLWLAVQGKLLTNSSRMHRHMTASATCTFCNIEDETTLHVLRDCSFTSEV
ncbi:Putative ribonuclease H protein At1g65750 [Linum perenne]